MTLHADGNANCDRCGADIGNAGVDKCVVISALTDGGGRIEILHLCLKGVTDDSGCASRVLTKNALSWYVDNVKDQGETPDWFVYSSPTEGSE